MSRLWLLLVLLLLLGSECCLCSSSSSEEEEEAAAVAAAWESRERRAAPGPGMGSSFIRFGRFGRSERSDAVSQPHTRSDLIIRYGRDGLNGRLIKLRQERMRRLARLALICAAKSQDDAPPSSAEEKILREICKDAPLHPTVPDFV